MRKFLTIFTLSLLAVSCIDNDYDLSDIDTDDIGIGDENSVFTCPLMTLRVAVADIVNEQGDLDGILAEADVWLPNRLPDGAEAVDVKRLTGGDGQQAQQAYVQTLLTALQEEIDADASDRKLEQIARQIYAEYREDFLPDYLPVDVDEAEYIAKDFFKRKAGLTVSGQLEGEVAAMAMGKIYTFGPTFRAENSNTPRHAAEFWQIEPEVAFAKLPDIIKVAESMIKFVISAVLEECSDEVDFFERAFEKGLRAKLESVVASDFAVLDYTDAIDILKKADVEFAYPVEWGLDLQTEHERYLTEQVLGKPVFVTNYPKKIKSFYMKQNDDGKTVAATDLLVPGVGEIIGCSEREADYDKLLSAMTERGMNLDDYKGYMELRKYGTVPHSGFGLGLERILMYVTGIGNIRDVQLYSRTTGDLMA